MGNAAKVEIEELKAANKAYKEFLEKFNQNPTDSSLFQSARNLLNASYDVTPHQSVPNALRPITVNLSSNLIKSTFSMQNQPENSEQESPVLSQLVSSRNNKKIEAEKKQQSLDVKYPNNTIIHQQKILDK